MLKSILISAIAVALAGCGGAVGNEMVLLDFESDADLNKIYWKCHALMSLSNEHATHGQSCLKLEFFPSDYPGLTPKLTGYDWRSYRSLRFDVYNPQKLELIITVRIDDKKKSHELADRYNQRFTIQPGPNQVEIPLDGLATSGTSRTLNLATIYQLMIFMVNPPSKMVLYIDYLRLVK